MAPLILIGRLSCGISPRKKYPPALDLALLALQLLPSWPVTGLVMLIGLVATLAESLFGALVQDRLGWMSNELVNALQTSLAAVLAITAMQI